MTITDKTEIPEYLRGQIEAREVSKQQAIRGAVERLELAQSVFKLEILEIAGMSQYGMRKNESTITADPTVAQYA